MIALLSLVACGPNEPGHILVEGPDGRTGIACASGCARPEAPAHVADDQIAAWLAALAASADPEASEALDGLLFHGAEVEAYLDHHGTDPLPADRAALLRSELARDRVSVAFRLETEDGRPIGHLEDVFPFVEHQDFLLADTGPFGRVSMNGKVKRVGAHHLWARF